MSFIFLWSVAGCLILARFLLVNSLPAFQTLSRDSRFTGLPAQANDNVSLGGQVTAGKMFSADWQDLKTLGYQTRQFERISDKIAELDILNHLGF
jgi:hypothetical protein